MSPKTILSCPPDFNPTQKHPVIDTYTIIRSPNYPLSYTFDMRDVPLDHWSLREQSNEREMKEPETGDYFKENTSRSLDAIYSTHELGQKYFMDVWKKKGAA